MNDQIIKAIADELGVALGGRAWGKVWQLSRLSLAIDFRAPDNRYLLVAVEPNQPRLYLCARPVRELERQSIAPSGFVMVLRKHLGGARLRALTKDADDRVVRFAFDALDALGEPRAWTLVVQLTGRAANLLLLDAGGRVVDTLRTPRGAGQEIGDVYQPPPQRDTDERPANDAAMPAMLPFDVAASPSAAADDYYRNIEAARVFETRAGAAAARLRQEIERRRKLERNLRQDLRAHGDAEYHKHAGDLLLANVATAERDGTRVRLNDYYAEGAPVIELEIDEHDSLPEAAARRFTRYTKAKRAAQEIAVRLAVLERELAALHAQQRELERITAERDDDALARFADAHAAKRVQLGAGKFASGKPGEARSTSATTRGGPLSAKASEPVPGARRYRSSDGYEILVGRAARDNDHLTFRAARPHDTWLHAADYPGSHVVVRNPTRGEVPQRTVLEAAQLAAFYSQAKADAKVAVNYTQRKFLSKPKGATPGLVRMSSFRTLVVEPREGVERV